MNDRELLEAAAKAAGFALTQWPDEDYPRAMMAGNWCPAFRPLDSDGDALRLFGRMPFCELYVSDVGVTVFLPRKPPGGGVNLKCDEYASEHGGDLQAATRRAIVRAAAAMCPREPHNV